VKSVNLVTLLLVIVGGLNWGLVGLFGLDLVAALLGDASNLSRLVYGLVGASALWQVIPFLAAALREPNSSSLGGSVSR
jgi:uncharacterized protein